MTTARAALLSAILGIGLVVPAAGRPASEQPESVTEGAGRVLAAEVEALLADTPDFRPSRQAIEMALAAGSPALDGLEAGDAARLVVAAARSAELSMRLGASRQQVKAQARQQIQVAALSDGSPDSLEQLRRVRLMGSAPPRAGRGQGPGAASDGRGPGGRRGFPGARG